MNNIEVWKSVAFSPSYKISNLGRFISPLVGAGTPKIYPSCIYAKVTIDKKPYYVHRLVAEHFIKSVSGKPHIHHKDHDKTNNAASNLQWVTPRENTIYTAKTGRMSVMKNIGLLGDHPRARKVAQKSIPDLRVIKIWTSMQEAANELGMTQSNICRAAGKNSKGEHGYFPAAAGGFVWEYVD